MNLMPLSSKFPLHAGTELHRIASTEGRRLERIPPKSERVMDYVIMGLWPTTRRSIRMNVALDVRRYSKGGISFETVPPHGEHAFSPVPALIYYCQNETINHMQFFLTSPLRASRTAEFPTCVCTLLGILRSCLRNSAG